MSKLTTISSIPTALCSLMYTADGSGPLAPGINRKPLIGADIRVNVNMVLVPVSVMDNYGRSVTGLRPENFQVVNGARLVLIVSFGRQDQPITVGLIFDWSGSMQTKFRIAREAPRELFQQLHADDESSRSPSPAEPS